MDRGKKIVVNDYEESTESALNRVAKKQNAHIFYSYALKAHFDFIFTEADSKALFAVEFDEGHHFMDPKTIYRDKLKSACVSTWDSPF